MNAVTGLITIHGFHVVALFGITTSTLTQLLDRWGYPVVTMFVAIESSGIPFPGEAMLLAASVYAGTGHHLSIFWVIFAGALGAIVGDNLGYAAGRFGGRPLITRYGKYVRLRPEQLDRAEAFFNKYGDKTVFFGRFVAVLRAWVAFLAGLNRMPWPKFLVFNAAGGIAWATLYGLLGYTLGHNLPLLYKVTKAIGIVGIAGGAVVVLVIGLVVWRRHRPAKATT